MQKKFLNTHQILQACASQPEKKEALVTQTFKLAESHRELVKKICESNGTTVSRFYQKCSETLISEYLD